MKIQPRFPRLLQGPLLLCAVFLFAISEAHALQNVVTYSPNSHGVTGNLPYSGSYLLSVTAPGGITTGYPATVTLQLAPQMYPLGTSAVAASYIQFSSPTLTFTAPGQTQTVTVYLNFPTTALSNAVPSGAYSYNVNTTGWPAGVQDSVAQISATVTTPPPASGNPPIVSIQTPVSGGLGPYTTFPVQVPFTFVASTDAASPQVNSVTAYVGAQGSPATQITNLSYTTLPSSNVAASGVFTVTGPGTYLLQAKARNSVGETTDTHTYTVFVTAPPPPTVAIASPAAGSTYHVRSDAPGGVVVPVSFTANAGYGNVRTLTATIDGTALTFIGNGIGSSPTASGNVNLTYTAPGSHTLNVTTTDDAGGQATAATNFVVVVDASSISGAVFFDFDENGLFGVPPDYGLNGILVTLTTAAGQIVASATSSADGTFKFSNVQLGSYVVKTSIPAGFKATSSSTRSIAFTGADVIGLNFGLALDFCALRGMKANGFTIGYWKNNLSKAIAGVANGAQVSAITMSSYTEKLGAFALAPFDGLTPATAVAIMSSRSSAPADLLAKQLLASEYNYESGAFIDGSATLTYAFVWWGEAVLKNASGLSSNYVLWAKDWFDAYNNSHGGVVDGPGSLTGSCSSGTTCSGDANSDATKKSESSQPSCDGEDDREDDGKDS